MPNDFKDALENLARTSVGLLGFIPTAIIARWLWHHRQWRLGRRRLFGADLVWELPAAVFGAVVGGGISEWAGLTGMASQAVVGVVAWFGPRGIEEVLRVVAERGSPVK